MKSFRKYDQNLDYNLFAEQGVVVTEILPWQFRLEHPNVPGRFVWYPDGGSLIYEKPEWGVVKVGEYTDSTQVYEKIKEKMV